MHIALVCMARKLFLRFRTLARNALFCGGALQSVCAGNKRAKARNSHRSILLLARTLLLVRCQRSQQRVYLIGAGCASGLRDRTASNHAGAEISIADMRLLATWAATDGQIDFVRT